MSALRYLPNLRKVDLGANRIRLMKEEDLSGLTNLEELWLGKNKIERIQGIRNLKKLRRLDLQSNRLTKIENLLTQVDTLEELYLAHNAIDDHGASTPDNSGLALPFTVLTTIDLSRNHLTSTKPFQHLECLEELWISGNKIKTFEDVCHIAYLGQRTSANLVGLYLEYNPIDKDSDYRKKLKEMLPSLKQIDANVVEETGFVIRSESLEQRNQKFRDIAIRRAQIETNSKKTTGA